MSDARFQPRLESIRGVAALMVALFHALAMVRMDEWLPLKIRAVLQFGGNGNAGVAIFFVLSGYVLAASLDASGAGQPRRFTADTLTFAVRRTFRIWPAMAACLAACFLWLRFVFEPATSAAASDDYGSYWRHGATWTDLLRDTVFLQSYLNPVTWTLQVEMLAALLFVPLWWISRRSRIALLGLTAAWAVWFVWTPHPPRAAFLFMMLLGLLVAPAARVVARHLGRRTIPTALALSFVGLWMATQYPRETAAGTWFVQSLCAGAIVTLLVASDGRAAFGWLDHRTARFMGRISYSFYLWHFPIVYVLVTLGFATIDATRWLEWPNAMAGLLFVVSTLVTIPIAWASYRAIELPLIRAAKAITRT